MLYFWANGLHIKQMRMGRCLGTFPQKQWARLGNEGKTPSLGIPEGVYKDLKVKCVSEDTYIQEYLVKLIVQSLGEHPTEEKIVLVVDDEAILRES